VGDLLGERDPGPRGSGDPGLMSEAPGEDPGDDPGGDNEGSGGGGDHLVVVGLDLTEVDRG